MFEWDDQRMMRQVATEAVQPLKLLLERILRELEEINSRYRREEAARHADGE